MDNLQQIYYCITYDVWRSALVNFLASIYYDISNPQNDLNKILNEMFGVTLVQVYI